APDYKQTFKVIQLQRNFLDIIEAAKVSDYLIFVLSAVQEVDEFGKSVLSAIQAIGAPSVFPVVQHDTDPSASKQLPKIKKSLMGFISYYFAGINQVYTCSSHDSTLQIVRSIANTVPQPISWRQSNPYLVADSFDFMPYSDTPNNNPTALNQIQGDLKITGHLRGANLSPNRLIHIPGHGEFQIKYIENHSSPSPSPAIASASASAQVPTSSFSSSTDPNISTQYTNSENVIIQPNPQEQDSLISFNTPDTTFNEQPDIDDSEMQVWKEKMAEMEKKEQEILQKKTKLVPKAGPSSHGKGLINGSNGSNGPEYDFGPSTSSANPRINTANDGSEYDSEEYEEIEVDEFGNPIESENSKSAVDHELPDTEESKKQLDEYLKLRAKQNADDQEFPDEVDTPLDTPAHIRFARYRGLQSFRTSPWDPYENLPVDYSRIFQLENYKKMKRSSLKSLNSSTIKYGSKITLVLKSVPKSTFDSISTDKPFCVFGLLPHENKYSVLNFLIKRNPEYEMPVKSKDEMIMMCGFRKMLVHPVYSQFNSGKENPNNVSKFERFLQQGDFYIGTVYAPICFGSSPSFVSMQNEVIPTLVGTGSVYSVDPTKVIAKRIVLTGVPFKINKKAATIRFMFYNPVDINYFKPVQLHTKYGRHGHISESLGTHGYMKCVFNGQIKAMDTVCMSLYKRVFPKWNTKLL
ncbi:hypothetical protein BB560_003913, partial [Smittium megazygosporum]